MRILLAYACTADLLPDLQRTLAVQQLLAPEAWSLYRKVIVTDRRMFRAVPTRAVERVVNCWDGEKLNLARMRNAAAAHAQTIGAEWLVHMDVDTVVLNYPCSWPSTGWGRPFVFQQPEFEWDWDLRLELDRWFKMGLCVLHRSIYETRKFCEEFSGYGHEENDFIENVMADIPEGDSDLRLVHLWHNARANQTHNLELFEARKLARIKTQTQIA